MQSGISLSLIVINVKILFTDRIESYVGKNDNLFAESNLLRTLSKKNEIREFEDVLYEDFDWIYKIWESPWSLPVCPPNQLIRLFNLTVKLNMSNSGFNRIMRFLKWKSFRSHDYN